MEQEIRKETIHSNNNDIACTLFKRSIDILDKKGKVYDQQIIYWGEITAMKEAISLKEIMEFPFPHIDDTRQVYLRTDNGINYYINKKGEVYMHLAQDSKQSYIGKISLEKTRIELGIPAQLQYKSTEITVFGSWRQVLQPMGIGTITSIRFSEEKV